MAEMSPETKFAVNAALIGGALVSAGCTSNEVGAAGVEKQLNPTRPTSTEVLESPPTVPPMPTEIAVTPSPTPTETEKPTTTPTETPTTEPTEEIKLEKICESWKDVTGCSVTVEDVTSGRMLDIDRAVAKQLGMETFPSEAYAVGDKFVIER